MAPLISLFHLFRQVEIRIGGSFEPAIPEPLTVPMPRSLQYQNGNYMAFIPSAKASMGTVIRLRRRRRGGARQHQRYPAGHDPRRRDPALPAHAEAEGRQL